MAERSRPTCSSGTSRPPGQSRAPAPSDWAIRPTGPLREKRACCFLDHGHRAPAAALPLPPRYPRCINIGYEAILESAEDRMIQPHSSPPTVRSLTVAGAVFAALCGAAAAAETQVQRGEHLVSVIPCTDCHTPGTFLGKPDTKRY